MALKDAPTSVLLENVLSLIHQKLPKNSASLVECFVAKFYGNMASTDLHDRNDSDLYGAALSLWNALNHRTGIEPYILEAGRKGQYVTVIGVYDNPQEPFKYQRVPLDHRF